jgi:16S rRNA (adenine1518-N6/adenine1519-N6)-dimethyltransferase
MVVEAILEAVGDAASVLEIGPGPGILTRPLTERLGPRDEGFGQVLALEIDPRMVSALRVSAPKAEVRVVDAMQADLAALLGELPAPRAVVSNLPYYITSPLLQRIAAAREAFSVAVLMMQKEVAGRVLAPPRSGERGSLSVYLQALFSIERVAEAPAALFVPPPKVDSMVLRFTPRQSEVDEGLLEFVREGFGNPRKTLANVLAATRRVERGVVLAALEAAGLGPTARAQELTLDDWGALREALR